MIVSNNIEKTFQFFFVFVVVNIYNSKVRATQLSKRQNRMWQVRTSNMRFLCAWCGDLDYSSFFVHFHLCIFFRLFCFVLFVFVFVCIVRILYVQSKETVVLFKWLQSSDAPPGTQISGVSWLYALSPPLSLFCSLRSHLPKTKIIKCT